MSAPETAYRDVKASAVLANGSSPFENFSADGLKGAFRGNVVSDLGEECGGEVSHLIMLDGREPLLK